MLRKIILAVLGIAMVGGAVFVAKSTIANKKEWKPRKEKKLVTGVFVENVRNSDIPINITTSGNLMAKNRIELFAEVQGIFNNSRRPFRPGTYYQKGEALIELDKKEEVIGLKAQKSSLYNQLVLLIPDLRLDYPDAIAKWDEYVNTFDVNQPLRPLPEPESDKEKLFLSGRNIYTSYYNVQNLETQLANYTIRAPFSGVLTQALVNEGSLIRPGQKLGEFIDHSNYELEVAINTAYGDLLGMGKTVDLRNVERTKSWQGKVVRVNSLVDPASQTIPTFIQVRGKGLKEGMYLEAEVTAKEEPNTYEVNRKLLVENEKLFVVRDSVLDLVTVEPVYFKENTAVVRGLPNGTKLVSKAIPGAYVGMKVKVFEDKTTALRQSLTME
ncbi:MAG: efflux RND transporter periplasmic adaptor subunit [Bacteroidota bacterium]